MSTPGFAIIDFETKGFSPAHHDRIVEVAVVHTDRYGRVEGEWETLVNPNRDVGPTRVHGIRAADILSAPTFDQIAPRLVELLRGRVIVAHNARFDTGFLLAELTRMGYGLDGDVQLSGLCTMQLAREFLPGSGRSLRECCAAYDIEIGDAHRASADALATARLLEAYIATQDSEYWNDLVDAAQDFDWPPLAVVDAAWIAREAAYSDPAGFLERISTRLPDHSGPEEHINYLALLDRCLLDQQLSHHEAQALVTAAHDFGISRDMGESLHRRYFADLATIAWEDGELTMDEITQLVTVGKLLSIPPASIRNAMQPPAAPDVADERPRRDTMAFSLVPGDLIVLTGDMVKAREVWERELMTRGFVPHPAVTKKVKLVVAADPDSLSGKARKARDYGLPIVDERGLASLLASSLS